MTELPKIRVIYRRKSRSIHSVVPLQKVPIHPAELKGNPEDRQIRNMLGWPQMQETNSPRKSNFLLVLNKNEKYVYRTSHLNKDK